MVLQLEHIFKAPECETALSRPVIALGLQVSDSAHYDGIDMMSQHLDEPLPSTGRISALSMLRQHVISHQRSSTTRFCHKESFCKYSNRGSIMSPRMHLAAGIALAAFTTAALATRGLLGRPSQQSAGCSDLSIEVMTTF